MMSNNLPKNNNPKLKWWQKGALVGFGLGFVTSFFVGLAVLAEAPASIFALIVELPVLPIFALIGNFLGTRGPMIIFPSLEPNTFLLVHFISWTLGGIAYAFIFHTIRRLTKHSWRNKKQ